MRDRDPFRPSDSVLSSAFDHICGSTMQFLWDFLGILCSGSPDCSPVKDSGSFSDFLNSSVCNTHIFPLCQAASFTISVSKAERVIRGLPLVWELYLTAHKENLCVPYFILRAEFEPYL